MRGMDDIKLEDVSCPLCGQYNETVVVRQIDRVHGIDKSTVWLLRSCPSCQHYYLLPRPDYASIGLFYPQTYAFHNPSKFKVIIRTLLRDAASQLYFPEQRPSDFEYCPPKSLLLRLAGWVLLPVLWRKGLCGAASVFMTSKTYGLSINPGTSFLEIGCGAGWELHLTDPSLSIRALARSGVQCIAVEPSRTCWKHLARDSVTVYPSVNALIAARPGTFDTIRLNWSLEHIHDPVGVFKQLRELCHPETRVIVTVPNYDGLTYSCFPDAIEVPVHLQYFTPASMRKLCEISRFRVDRLQTFCTPSHITYLSVWSKGKFQSKFLCEKDIEFWP